MDRRALPLLVSAALFAVATLGAWYSTDSRSITAPGAPDTIHVNAPSRRPCMRTEIPGAHAVRECRPTS